MEKISTLSALFLIVFSQSAFCVGEEEMGQAAEKAGKTREALTQYVAALQSASEGSADDQRLREKIIQIAQKLDPAPAVPDEAQRYAVRGKTAMEGAKSPSDFTEASAEFAKALKTAPWWGESYYNLAVAQEGAGQLAEAMRSLKLYLLAAPGAPDAKAVQDKIYSLEYREEKAENEKRKTEDLKNLEGLWTRTYLNSSAISKYTVTVEGDHIKIVWSQYGTSSGMQTTESFAGKNWFEGIIEGQNITGTYSIDRTFWNGGRVFSYPFTGKVNEDRNTITLRHTTTDITGATGRSPNGWREFTEEFELKR